jgi:hypothetical protein
MIREHGRPTKAEKRSRKKKVNENLFVRQLDVTAAAVMSPKKTTIWYFFSSLPVIIGRKQQPECCTSGCMLARMSLARLLPRTTIINGVSFFFFSLIAQRICSFLF